MGPMAQPILESYRFSQFIMNLVTRDLKNDDALKRVRGGQGPSITWIVGHLCHFRYLAIQLLGTDEPSPFAELFEGGASDGANYPDIKELRAKWNHTHERLEAVFKNVTDEQLTKRLKEGAHGESNVLAKLVFYMWHESYHMGQLGAIRTELGYRPTADLAVQAATRG